MANIIRMPITSTSFTPEQALHASLADDLEDVVIVGYDRNGEWTLRSSRLTRAESLFLLTRACRWAEGLFDE